MKPDKSQWSQWKLGGNPNKTKLTNTTRRGKNKWNRWKWHHKKLYGLGIRFGVGSSDKQTQRRNFGSFAAKWLGPILGTRDLIFYFLLLRRFVVEAARVEARGRRRYFRDYRRAPFRRFFFFGGPTRKQTGINYASMCSGRHCQRNEEHGETAAASVGFHAIGREGSRHDDAQWIIER